MLLDAISEKIQSRARELGFELCGLAAVDALPGEKEFAEWIGQGCAGEMGYLAARNEQGLLKRAAVANAAPWARSAIVCAASYHDPNQPLSIDCHESDRGWISRYAWAERDYHDVLLPKLRDLESTVLAESAALKSPVSAESGTGAEAVRTWCYVDTGPVREKALAAQAGLGWQGKNSCLIHPKLGSWLFLGVILCSLELESSAAPQTDRCGSCRRCLEACPTQALVAPGVLDARRCLAYLTVELKDAIPEELRPGLGRNVYGCDICQDVCPWNRRAAAATAPGVAARTEVVNPQLGLLSDMNKEAFRARFGRSALRRRKLAGLLRSTAIAMGNSGDARFRPRLEQMAAQTEDTVLAAHALWALERLAEPEEAATTPAADAGKAGGQ
jgi:epoxyqueuosine reductase